MKRTGIFTRATAILMVVCMMAFCLAACGAEEVTVKIDDNGTQTKATANTDMTVEQVLKSADITLGEKDVTEPAKDTLITASTKEIIVKRYAKVTVVYGKEKKVVELVGGTVDGAIKAAGFIMEDGVTPDAELTDYLQDGATITLAKSIKVKLIADGEEKTVETRVGTVKDLLAEQGITLDEDDEVSPKAGAALKNGAAVTVKRVTYKEVTKEETIEYDTEEKYSDSMEEGTSEITQNGVNGEKKVTYKVKYVDGKEDSKEVVKETVTKQPVKEIIVYGTKSKSGSGDKVEVSRQQVPNCDDPNHGYYIVRYSDGSVEYPTY